MTTPAPVPTVHACPADGSDLTPCCHRNPAELPRTDRITSGPEAATCPGPEPDPICGTVHYDYPETICTEAPRHRLPHGGPLMINGRECGGAAWGPDDGYADPPATPAPVPDPALVQRVARAIAVACHSGAFTHEPTHAPEYQAAREQWQRAAAAVLAELATTPGYCPHCGRGDLAPTADQWAAAERRADRAEAALAAGIPLICSDERHQAKVTALEAALTEARAIIADLTDPDPCWYDHHGYCQAHGWFATEPPCPHARAKALTRNDTAKEDR